MNHAIPILGILKRSQNQKYAKVVLGALGWTWTRIATQAIEKGETRNTLLQRKVGVARFFAKRILPQVLGLERSILNGAGSLVEMGSETL